MSKCPDCAAPLDIDEDEVEEGETLSCAECAADLEVVGVHPLQLEVIEADEEEEEDEFGLDDEDYDEDEDEEEY